MIWSDDELKNPLSGATLKRDTPHSLTDGAARFPVVENIPFLRVNRDELRAEVLAKLDAGDERGALILLFQDQDDWAKTAPPTETDLQPIFDEKINLREAMRCLQYGAVADYFAFRWSDPTFLSGLCLLENHLPQNAKNVFELCCGIGHYLREFDLRDIEATGADVVFSKLWLTRKFVALNAKLVCFDANFDFPFAGEEFDAAFCHDAFYFLPEKQRVAGELKRVTKSAILIGHAHNREAENYSSGAAISTAEYAAMFEGATFYDDAELMKALIENRQPQPAAIDELKKTEAVSLATTARKSERAETFALPIENQNLRINPLLDAGNFGVLSAPNYPSERYENEYAPLSGYLNLKDEDMKIVCDARLNENWLNNIDLVRRRILLDLPENW